MNYCSECTYLKPDSEDLYGRYWCETRLERVLATDEECYRFCRAYSRSSSTSEKFEKISKDKSESQCYLTTVMCQILKMTDDNYFLNTMRHFRNETLQKNEKYKHLLVEYDIIGPKIVQNIMDDPMRVKISVDCMYNYIKPITKLIKTNENDSAVNMYTEMTNKLKSLYNIDSYISVEQINKADINKSGHGVYVLKKSQA